MLIEELLAEARKARPYRLLAQGRELLGMEQKELAALVPCDPSEISKVERGVNLHQRRLQRIYDRAEAIVLGRLAQQAQQRVQAGAGAR